MCMEHGAVDVWVHVGMRGTRHCMICMELRKGPSKQKWRALTWLVGSSEAKKVPGLVSFFPDVLYRL
jgi:hypothetical protein